MPKVMPEYLELRRQQILDAAAACFTREGFHQTTMQDICAEADLSPGAVYRYFPSKEAIIQAMCLRGRAEDVTRMREVMSHGGTLDTFNELADIYFGETSNHEMCALMIELVAEARRDEFILASVREDNEVLLKPLIELIETAQARGEINPALEPRAVAQVMLALYQGLVHQKSIEPDMPVSGFVQVVKALFGGRFWLDAPAAEAQAQTSGAALRH